MEDASESTGPGEACRPLSESAGVEQHQTRIAWTSEAIQFALPWSVIAKCREGYGSGCGQCVASSAVWSGRRQLRTQTRILAVSFRTFLSFQLGHCAR